MMAPTSRGDDPPDISRDDPSIPPYHPEGAIWRERGAPLLPPLSAGPLDGLTVAVKDLFPVAGFPVGAGNPTWLAGARPEPADAWAVRALREAGASIAGIAQTDELAFSLSGTNPHYGTPPNPAAPGLVTAGSSSGPAAAVAAGQADIGLGTDTAGSIRVPASACGLYGLRPTHGAIPDAEVHHLAPSFDTVGWMTRDAAMLTLVGQVLLPPGSATPGRPSPSAASPGVDGRNAASGGPPPLPGPRRLLCPGPAAELGRRVARDLGLPLEAGAVPGIDDNPGLPAAFRAVQAAEAWELHGDWITANPGALGSDVEARFRYGATVSAGDRRAAWALITESRARFLDALGDDAWLVLPASGGPAHPRDATAEVRDAWRQATLRLTVPASAFGLPSVSVPSGTSPPEGVALIGPPGSDHALLRAAGTHQ
jgi:amidase